MNRVNYAPNENYFQCNHCGYSIGKPSEEELKNAQEGNKEEE